MGRKVTIQCFSCGMRIRAPQDSAARIERCPRCGEVLTDPHSSDFDEGGVLEAATPEQGPVDAYWDAVGAGSEETGSAGHGAPGGFGSQAPARPSQPVRGGPGYQVPGGAADQVPGDVGYQPPRIPEAGPVHAEQGHACYMCGRVINLGSAVCPYCGARQYAVVSPSEAPSRVAAALLAIFLGYLGAHKFYLGRPVQGVVYLLIGTVLGCPTFGVGTLVISIIALIEGLVYLSYSDREFAARYSRS